MEENLPSKWKEKEKKARVAILVSYKANFNPTKIKKQGHNIMAMGTIPVEEPTILNVYDPI